MSIDHSGPYRQSAGDRNGVRHAAGVRHENERRESTTRSSFPQKLRCAAQHTSLLGEFRIGGAHVKNPRSA